MKTDNIKTIIVDDEPGSLFILKKLLENYCPDVEVISTLENPIEALDVIRELKPDLVFLDIEMPYANAFDLLDRLKPVSFEVIFITAFNEYALKAFKYAAVDYLLKPISIVDLKESVERVKKVLKGSLRYNDKVNGLIENLKNPVNNIDILSLPSLRGMDFIELKNVIFIVALGNYAEINFGNGKKLVVTKSLKEMEDLLPETSFYRVHHSYIISLKHVSTYIKGRGGYVILSDGTKLSVAVRKKMDFLDLLNNAKSAYQANS
jgi:two-component system LytT family response regulator